MHKLKLLALCGSTKKDSANLKIIKQIQILAADNFVIQIFDSIDKIPCFNPDLDNTLSTPEAVILFRKQLNEADGVLICSPEYANGVPGALKNCIDWTVSSMEFSNKPVALITAGTSGTIAHQSLLGTLLIIESKITEATQIVIPFVKTKISSNGNITDGDTKKNINNLIHSLQLIISNPESVSFLLAPRMND